MPVNFTAIVFFSVLVLTIMAGGAAIILPMRDKDPSPVLRDVIRTMLWLFVFGAGAIIGMIGSVLP